MDTDTDTDIFVFIIFGLCFIAGLAGIYIDNVNVDDMEDVYFRDTPTVLNFVATCRWFTDVRYNGIYHLLDLPVFDNFSSHMGYKLKIAILRGDTETIDELIDMYRD